MEYGIRNVALVDRDLCRITKVSNYTVSDSYINGGTWNLESQVEMNQEFRPDINHSDISVKS